MKNHYKKILDVLTLLKEDCLSVTCEECIFNQGHDLCFFNTLPESYDLKDFKKINRDYEKLQKQISNALKKDEVKTDE